MAAVKRRYLVRAAFFSAGVPRMADNLGVTPGSGKVIRTLTDDNGSDRQVIILDTNGVSGEAADPANPLNPFPVKGNWPAVVSAAQFTLPGTTAYAVGDLIANNATAGSVTPLSFANVSRAPGLGGWVIGFKLLRTGVDPNNGFRLHLYSAAPTPANGDNGAWSTNLAAYLGYLDSLSCLIGTDGSLSMGKPVDVAEIPYTSTTLYGLLEARSALVPKSPTQEQFTVSLLLRQN